MSRLLVPVVAGLACLGGLIATGILEMPESSDAPATKPSISLREDKTIADTLGISTASRQDGDAQPVSSPPSPIATDERTEKFVRGIVTLAATSSAGRDEANERVRKLFLAAHRGQSTVFASNVAERLVDRLPGTDIGAQAEAFRIVAHVQQTGDLDSRTMQLLADFSQDYISSELPIKIYKWTADRLVENGRTRSAMKLINHGISASRGHRDVSGLEAHLRITKQTEALARRAGNTNSSVRAKVHRPAKKSLTDASSKYGKHLGKPMHLSGITSAGRAFSSSSLRGHWTVVHYWATWCPKCVSDTPGLLPLYDQYAKQGVRFVGVSLDNEVAKLKKFTSDQGIHWPQLVVGSGEEAGWDTPLARQNGISSIPAVFLLSPDGNVVEAGQDVGDELSRAMRHHLGL